MGIKIGIGLYPHLLTPDTFRNVRGKVPHYVEEFIDAGDVDMVRALRLYHKHRFDGVLIPDHTPEMACAAPWHAGMAYALGWMRAAVSIVESEGSAPRSE